MCLGLDVGGQPRRSADRAAGHASGASGGEVQRLPRRGMSPRRFIGPPLYLALRAICNMKNVRLVFPIAFGFPKRLAVAPGSKLGPFISNNSGVEEHG